MRLRLVSFLSFSAATVWLLVGSAFVVDPQPVNAQNSTCYVWSGQGSLQSAVDGHACVKIAQGEWLIDVPIVPHEFSTIRGENRNGSVVRASCSFQNIVNGGPVDAMFAANGVTGVILTNFTIDAACPGESGRRVPQSLGGAGANGMLIDGMVVKGARCWGVAINGPGMVVRNTIIAENGSDCPSYPPGAGIYANPDLIFGVGIALNPAIYSNEIRDNIGPALDVNGVWHGTFANNTVTGNSHWAAVSLYGSSHWNITGNVIVHPSTLDVQPYLPECAGGPIGNGSAGIFLCQKNDTDTPGTLYNVIANNSSSGRYGILSIGNDQATPYWAPRLNVFFNNNVIGSWHGCADDFTPGQYLSDDNRWNNNNCAGTPNTGPTYF